MPAEGGRRADPAGTTLKTPAKAQPPLVAPRAGDPMGGPARAVSSSLTQTPRFPPPSRFLVPPFGEERVKAGKSCILSK